jgi:hypothetical protein
MAWRLKALRAGKLKDTPDVIRRVRVLVDEAVEAANSGQPYEGTDQTSGLVVRLFIDHDMPRVYIGFRPPDVHDALQAFATKQGASVYSSAMQWITSFPLIKKK